MTFASLGLIDPLLRTLETLDYRKPTPVQIEAIPAVLKARPPVSPCHCCSA